MLNIFCFVKNVMSLAHTESVCTSIHMNHNTQKETGLN